MPPGEINRRQDKFSDYATDGVIHELKEAAGFKRLPSSYFKLFKNTETPKQIIYKLKVNKKRVEKVIKNVKEEVTALEELLTNPDLQ